MLDLTFQGKEHQPLHTVLKVTCFCEFISCSGEHLFKLICYKFALSVKKCYQLNPQHVEAGQALSDIYRETGKLQVQLFPT
jgi:hypothetical protein